MDKLPPAIRRNLASRRSPKSVKRTVAKRGEPATNLLYYGDNLDILRSGVIPENSIALCYIDPPFNSKRTYNQIYNNIGEEDVAQAQAFIDTWKWDVRAIATLNEVLANDEGRFTNRTIALAKGLHEVLGEGSLLAYLLSMMIRVNEIQRVLRPDGTFYLHCDPTASHYLKLVLDSVFIPRGGEFRNEIVWCYAGGGIPRADFPRKHDTIFRYTKSNKCYFKPIMRPYTAGTVQRGRTQIKGKYFEAGLRAEGTPVNDWWSDVPKITSPTDPEKLGYPTQKSKALLRRIIEASSKPGDTVLDAYCGCGTTIEVAQDTGRPWVGIDITYQAISVILFRLERAFGKDILPTISISGVPRDVESARALAENTDDRVRKEFEKWAILTFSENRAVVNEKKGADQGIDGRAYTLTGKGQNAKIAFQAKSGHVSRRDIATLIGDMQREKAALGYFITLEEPTEPMRREARAAGTYMHPLMGKSYNRIQIITVREIIEEARRLELPLAHQLVKSAQKDSTARQLGLSV
jgi:DNA modification methylase